MTTEQFYRYVDKTPGHGPKGDCWLWIGHRDKQGYGKVKTAGWHLAHRYAFYLHYGKSPDPCALHTCDNPPCCNPAHLFAGTNADNYKDFIAKGRVRRSGSARGEDCSYSKLQEADVHQIRRLAAAGISYTELSRSYPLVAGSIRRIVRRESWAWLGDCPKEPSTNPSTPAAGHGRKA